MRHAFLLFLGIACAIVQAQDIPRPEFMDQPYAYDSATGSIVQLERCPVLMKAGMQPVCDSMSSTSLVPGGKATSFLVVTGEPFAPSSMKLYRVTVKKGKRYWDFKRTNENEIICNVKKQGDDLYEIIPANALLPGEYAFVVSMSYFTFRVE
jgi:hypothetical protein